MDYVQKNTCKIKRAESYKDPEEVNRLKGTTEDFKDDENCYSYNNEYYDRKNGRKNYKREHTVQYFKVKKENVEI